MGGYSCKISFAAPKMEGFKNENGQQKNEK
jgi:hypothetical protein